MSRLRRIVSLTVASTCLFPGAALAADWGPTTTVATAPADERFWDPSVAADAAGNETAVWRTLGDVWSATKPAGGAWTEPVLVAATGGATALKLSVGPNGHAVIAWVRGGFFQSGSLVTMTRTPAGVWSPPETVRDESLEPDASLSFGANIGVSANGAIVASSDVRRSPRRTEPIPPTGSALQASTRPAGGSWDLAQDVETGVVFASDLAVAADGTATIAYSPANGSLAVVTRPAGGTWSAPQTIAEPSTGRVGQPGDVGRIQELRLAANGSGATAAVWTRLLGESAVVQSARRPAGGDWAPTQTVASSNGQDVLADLDAEVDDAGRVTAVWQRTQFPQPFQGVAQLLTSTVKSGTTWPTPVGLTNAVANTPGSPSFAEPQLVAAGTDQAVVTFAAKAGSGLELRAAVRTAGADFAPAESLSAAPDLAVAGHSSVEVSASGAATALWTERGRILARSVAGTTPVTPKRVAEVSVGLWAFGASKCPTKAEAWSSAPRATLDVTRIGFGGVLRCRATGAITVPATAKLGSSIPVIVTGASLLPVIAYAKVVAG